MSEYPCVIIIDIPQPEDTCFVVMPMSNEESAAPQYSGVLDVIQSAANLAAANGSHIRAHRTDETTGRDIPYDIVQGIRSARLVVAVIGPSHEAKYNPNVMYELGMAHALGKPTIILTSSRPGLSMPFDVSHYNCISYGINDLQDSIKKKSLTSQLYITMETLLKREKEGLIDPTWVGVRAETARLCSIPDFRASLKVFFSFSQDLQRHIPEPKKTLENLSQEVSEVFRTGATTKGQDQNILTAWNDHNRLYVSIPRGLLRPRLEEEQAFKDSMHVLLERAKQYGKEKEFVIQKAESFYKGIRYQLKLYGDLQKEVSEKLSSTCQDDFENILRDQEFVFGLHRCTKSILDTTDAILVRSNNMVSTLIDLID